MKGKERKEKDQARATGSKGSLPQLPFFPILYRYFIDEKIKNEQEERKEGRK